MSNGLVSRLLFWICVLAYVLILSCASCEVHPWYMPVINGDSAPICASAVMIMHGYFPHADYFLAYPGGASLLLAVVLLVTGGPPLLVLRLLLFVLSLGRLVGLVGLAFELVPDGGVAERHQSASVCIAAYLLSDQCIYMSHTYMADTVASTFLVLAVYLSYRSHALASGMCSGMAVAAKHSWLVPAVLVWALLLTRRRGDRSKATTVFLVGAFLTMLWIGLLALRDWDAFYYDLYLFSAAGTGSGFTNPLVLRHVAVRYVWEVTRSYVFASPHAPLFWLGAFACMGGKKRTPLLALTLATNVWFLSFRKFYPAYFFPVVCLWCVLAGQRVHWGKRRPRVNYHALVQVFFLLLLLKGVCESGHVRAFAFQNCGSAGMHSTVLVAERVKKETTPDEWIFCTDGAITYMSGRKSPHVDCSHPASAFTSDQLVQEIHNHDISVIVLHWNVRKATISGHLTGFREFLLDECELLVVEGEGKYPIELWRRVK